jgi:hypothetical protein
VIPWSGKSVGPRLNLLDARIAELRTLEEGPPSEYELAAKQFYGRMRDCWERLIEEKVFSGVVTRFSPEIQTRKLRFVEVPDSVFARIDAGMTRTSSFSHDNPAAGSHPIPPVQEIAADLTELKAVLKLVDDNRKAVEKRRGAA